MEKDTASLDVYLSSPGVKPRCVPSSAEHLGEAAIELHYKIEVDRLKPNSSIVASPVKRAVPELHAYDVRKFGSRLSQEPVRAPEWCMNPSKPVRELAFGPSHPVPFSQGFGNLGLA